MPATVFVHFRFQSDKGGDGLAELKQVLPDTRSYDGCTSLAVVRDQVEPDHIVLIERWDSREKHEQYRAWRDNSGTMVRVGQMLAAPPEIAYFDEEFDL